MSEPLPHLLVLPGEAENDRALFAATPLHAVKRFLECFDSDGGQCRAVPNYILEEIARRFQRAMQPKSCSLDEAFGGRVARQRNAVATEEHEWSVVWEIIAEREAAAKLSSQQRSKSTPLEWAISAVAERRHMSTDNVRRIWTKSGKS